MRQQQYNDKWHTLLEDIINGSRRLRNRNPLTGETLAATIADWFQALPDNTPFPLLEQAARNLQEQGKASALPTIYDVLEELKALRQHEVSAWATPEAVRQAIPTEALQFLTPAQF